MSHSFKLSTAVLSTLQLTRNINQLNIISYFLEMMYISAQKENYTVYDASEFMY